jgi:hypothetical protein
MRKRSLVGAFGSLQCSLVGAFDGVLKHVNLTHGVNIFDGLVVNQKLPVAISLGPEPQQQLAACRAALTFAVLNFRGARD